MQADSTRQHLDEANVFDNGTTYLLHNLPTLVKLANYKVTDCHGDKLDSEKSVLWKILQYKVSIYSKHQHIHELQFVGIDYRALNTKLWERNVIKEKL